MLALVDRRDKVKAQGGSSQRNTFTRRAAPAPGRRTHHHRAAARQPANSLHVTLSHKPPQHRGLPRPEGAPSRQTPDAVFAAASPRGRRKDDASRNNRARSASRALVRGPRRHGRPDLLHVLELGAEGLADRTPDGIVGSLKNK